MVNKIIKIGLSVISVAGLALGIKKGKDSFDKYSLRRMNFPTSKVRRDEIFFFASLASASMSLTKENSNDKSNLLRFLEDYYFDKFKNEKERLLKIYENPQSLKQIKEFYDAIHPAERRLNDYQHFLFACLTYNDTNTTIDKVLYLKVYMLLNQNWEEDIYLISDSSDIIKITDYVKELVVIKPQDELLELFPSSEINNTSKVFFKHPEDDIRLLSIDEVMNENFVFEKDIEVLEALRLCGAKKVILKLIDESDKSFSAKIKEKDNFKSQNETEDGKRNDISVDDKTSLGFEIINNHNTNEEYCVNFIGGRESSKKRKLFITKSRWLNNDDQIRWIFESCSQKSRPDKFKYITKYKNITKLSTAVSVFNNLKNMNAFSFASDQSIEAKYNMLATSKRIYDIEF
jgi:hypothetical protein